MSLSKCFLATRNRSAENQLRCISCHDPHVEPTAAEASDYFKSKCLDVSHQGQLHRAACRARQATTPSDNCTGCHMPQRVIRVISHSSATNHRILRTADEPFPDETFNQATTAMPDLIELNPTGRRSRRESLGSACADSLAGLRAAQSREQNAVR